MQREVHPLRDRGSDPAPPARGREVGHRPTPGGEASTERELPHAGVYARLGLSPIHGIGVFAIRPIPQGTDIFANDRVEMVWVEAAALEAADLLPEERRLYHDFGIARGTLIGCPVNFHNLTPGWYCNQPSAGARPNVHVGEDFSFFARVDIAAGEELTVAYAEFSDAAVR